MEHKPVMLAEVLKYLDCREGDLIIDCTLGGGGHAMAILEKIGSKGTLIGIDMDDNAIEIAAKNLERFGQQVVIVKERYENVDSVAENLSLSKIDGAVIDLGASMFHFSQKERGFSYFEEWPLDMRMNPTASLTAEEVVNSYTEAQLSGIFYRYGNERWASRVAKFIVESRSRRRIKTTADLVEIIKNAIPASARRKGGHPARKIFQALRIEVNQELVDLEKTIEKLVDLLSEGRRLVIISYHSLEDRITKKSFKKLSNEKIVKIITKKPLLPSNEEIEENQSARSAKLRVLEKSA